MSVVGAALRGFGKALKKFGKQKTTGTEVIRFCKSLMLSSVKAKKSGKIKGSNVSCRSSIIEALEKL